MVDTSGKQAKGGKQPEAPQQGASNRLTATLVSLAALAILGAATANSLPNSDRFSLPSFDRIAMPNFDRLSWPKFDFSWPNFNRTAPPKSSRLAELAPPRAAPPPLPDPAVYAALTDIQFTQGQNATTLASLTESSATQQADLKRISRQLMSLSAQVSTLQSGMALTTGSITPSNPRARIIRTSRKATPAAPPLPKPVGPVSIGGAPLTPALPARSGA